MTKQLCRDCKHLETDGMFGIFCGVGGDNTKYDCPKYEGMAAKRFKYVEFTRNILSFDDNGVCKFFKEQEFEDWLNELNEENTHLKLENEQLKKLNIPIDEIKDTVSDYRGRIIGVYYND